jgi:hypothetical protein
LKIFSPKTKVVNDVLYIYDDIRRKYLVLTPEEKVRQAFIHYLISEVGYSKNHIRTEMGLKYHSLSKRSDILVFDKNGQPYMLVECKAESVILNQEVVEQASRYNLVSKAPYLCVTNGKSTFCFHIDFEQNRTAQLKSIPLPQV